MIEGGLGQKTIVGLQCSRSGKLTTVRCCAQVVAGEESLVPVRDAGRKCKNLHRIERSKSSEPTESVTGIRSGPNVYGVMLTTSRSANVA